MQISVFSHTLVPMYTYVGLIVTKYHIHNKKLLNFIVSVCNKEQNETKNSSLTATCSILNGLQSLISNPGGGEIFRTRLDRPWGPPSLLYNGYRVFPGVRRPGRGVDHPPPSRAEVEGRVQLYLYSPSGPSWPVLGRTLPLPIYIYTHI